MWGDQHGVVTSWDQAWVIWSLSVCSTDDVGTILAEVVPQLTSAQISGTPNVKLLQRDLTENKNNMNISLPIKSASCPHRSDIGKQAPHYTISAFSIHSVSSRTVLDLWPNNTLQDMFHSQHINARSHAIEMAAQHCKRDYPLSTWSLHWYTQRVSS